MDFLTTGHFLGLFSENQAKQKLFEKKNIGEFWGKN